MRFGHCHTVPVIEENSDQVVSETVRIVAILELERGLSPFVGAQSDPQRSDFNYCERRTLGSATLECLLAATNVVKKASAVTRMNARARVENEIQRFL